MDQRFEYEMLPAYGFGPRGLVASIRAAPTESRGKIILLVDSTLTNSLVAELNQLKEDLVGDGWGVLRHDVPRHNDATWSNNPPNIALISSQIRADYNLYSNAIKSIFIIGHVSVPYSRYTTDDGHSTPPFDDHRGAWPTDGYYADIETNLWTDSSTNFVNQTNEDNSNRTGEGKFDNNTFPSALEFSVGRIDFGRMPDFTQNPPPGVPVMSEIDLLKQYLAKNHRFRHKELVFPERFTVGAYSETYRNYDLYDNALLNVSRWYSFNPKMVVPEDIFTAARSSSWGFQSGFGSPGGMQCHGQYYSAAYLTYTANEPPIGFYMLSACWLGDWNSTNNLLRATLATGNYGLASVWGLSTRWRFQQLGLDDTFGEAFLLTVHNTNFFVNGARRSLSLMGDPTPRLQMIAPPCSLKS